MRTRAGILAATVVLLVLLALLVTATGLVGPVAAGAPAATASSAAASGASAPAGAASSAPTPAASPPVSAAAPAAAAVVHAARIEGTIGPITADYLRDELARAAEAHAELLFVGLDTPGGLDSSMRQMIRGIMASEVPVAVWVGPAGARAASAGVFILTAAHIAAMAPATNVGAAHPVNLGGPMDSTMSHKVENDAVAYLQSLARERGRNVEWSEQVVRQSVSVEASRALELGIVDYVVPDRAALLAAVDGRSVTAAGLTRTLRTAGAVVVERPMSWRYRLLQRITDPTLAYIFMMLGFLGLFLELSHPGTLLPGVVGVICLLLAFLAFQSLPVNYVGVLLILLGLLLLLEIKVTSYGALTVAGLGGLLLGSLMLYDSPGPLGRLPLLVILPVVGVTAAFFLTVVGLGLAAQRRRHFSGLEAMVGQRGEVVRAGSERGELRGRILVAGELWEFLSHQELRKGDVVQVVDRRDKVLVVAPVAGEPSAERKGS